MNKHSVQRAALQATHSHSLHVTFLNVSLQMPSCGFSVCEVLRPELKELTKQACVFRGEEPSAPPPPPEPTSCVVEKTAVLPPPSLPLAQSKAEGPVCLQIPLLLPSLSHPVCLSPPPYISHSRSLFDSVSQGLMTDTDVFQVKYKLKRWFKTYSYGCYI